MKNSDVVEAEVAKIPNCDYPHDGRVPAVYDAKSNQGGWAYMCQPCFEKYGTGLGLGLGQRLVLAS